MELGVSKRALFFSLQIQLGVLGCGVLSKVEHDSQWRQDI